MSENDATITEQDTSTCPLVSVVIPTRGRADLLAQCVESILLQTLGDIEVIVVVDGPDPATIDFLTNLDDDRLGFVVHPESRGVSNARNSGIDLATGRWLAFCDDDDVWAPTKLTAQLAALRETPDAQWAVAGEIRVDQDHGTATCPPPPVAEVISARLPHWNPVPGGCSGVIADRRRVIELGGFDPRLSAIADWSLWIQLNWSSVVAVAAEPLVGYRDHGGAMTRRLRKIEDELDVISEQYCEQLAEYEHRFPTEHFYLWAYQRTFRTGDWRGGLNLAVRSPRFRRTVARHVWTQGKYRLRVMRGLEEPAQPLTRRVTVSEFPWLGTMLGPEPSTPTAALDDEDDHHDPGGAVSDVAPTT